MKKVYVKPAFQAIPEPPSDSSNRRRSHRVVLRVSLLIRAETKDGKSLQGRGSTVVVNAHGGLLETSLAVLANDEITLMLPQTAVEARCRVIRTERSPSGNNTIAIEFREPTAVFWPITFPPDDWADWAEFAP